MLDLNSDLLLKVSNIAIRAGSEIMKFYSEDPEIFTKKDNSPLTQADLSSNKIMPTFYITKILLLLLSIFLRN